MWIGELPSRKIALIYSRTSTTGICLFPQYRTPAFKKISVSLNVQKKIVFVLIYISLITSEIDH